MLLTAACGGDDTTPVERVAQERRAQAEQAAKDAGLPEPVQTFLGQAASAVASAFTVTYEADGVRTTLAQRPPERRIDVMKDGQTESLLRLRDGTFACNAQGCKREDAAPGIDPDLGVFAPGRLKQTVDALGAARAAFRFEVVDKQVAGITADCLVTTPEAGGEADELCIAPTGVILRIRSAAQKLEAVSYSATVDAAAFKAPAA